MTTTNPFTSLSTEALLDMLQRHADACVAVVQMNDEDRHAVGKKGQASPDQAGAFSAVCALQVSRVLKSRGVDTGL